jgi:hypothetical protein
VRKVLLFTTLILVLLMAMAEPVAASWYAGNTRTSTYGVKANIATPGSAPNPAVGQGTSSWVSTNPYPNPGFVQTGWMHAPNYGYTSATPYGEYKTDGGFYRQYHYGTQAWGTSKNYKLSFGAWGWYVYIDNDLKFVVGGFAYPPITALALSEVHDSQSNVLNTWFSTVQWRNNGGTWANFDQDYWVDTQYPYTVDKYTYYLYRCYGPQ